MCRIYDTLPAYSFIKNGFNDLIITIVVDKTEDDIYKVTFTAYSSNNGYISTFIFCRAYLIINIKQWKSKRIIRTILLQPWIWILANKLIYTFKDMMKLIIILFNQINYDKPTF